VSRAFVRESDNDGEALPERPVSEHPNFVTARGLEQIESRIHDLEAQRQAARAADDTAALAGIDRDLRYWAQRKGSARLVERTPSPETVRFGTQVVVRLETEQPRVFRLVGEDEADPAQGLLSWVSPLAQSVLGRRAGETIRFQGREGEILSVEP
jgi:transcription elongation GreA/GreB family factor